MQRFSVKSNLVDIHQRRIYAAEITVSNGIIENICEVETASENFILPGFVDAHIHIESSMLLPSEFARIAVQHGTVATVSDPHEIANVCGLQGVNYMIHNGKQVPFKFNFGAPSCVPATQFETAGATLDSEDVAQLLSMPEIKYLSEMMNYPGVLHQDPEVIAKIKAAQAVNKPIDGHAPGVTGQDAINYINAGISTDHECFTYDEALFKLQHGMKVLIREGSAARNFAALHPLIPDWHHQLMFCCDDKHPDELLLNHINKHVVDAIALGYDVFDVLQIACINPVRHYNLNVGMLNVGDPADFIVVKDLKQFSILQTYIDGKCVYDNHKCMIPAVPAKAINNFGISEVAVEQFEMPYHSQVSVPVIVAIDGELITQRIDIAPHIVDNKVVADVDNDILKLAVINRYQNAPVALALIKNFGLKHGAIASTVAHDCHNIIVVGTNDHDMHAAATELIKCKGGISVVNGNIKKTLALPVAGLMSLDDVAATAENYQAVDAMAKELGCTLRAPFMTLSFMALLVIPNLKLSDKGLFDGEKFEFVG